MAYCYITEPLLRNRIMRYTDVTRDHHELARLGDVLREGQSLVWYIHEMHDCSKVHEHAVYVLRARTVGIPLEKYKEGEYMRRIFIFNDSTRNALWDFLEKNFKEAREDFKEMSEKQFYETFLYQHPVNIGVCLCSWLYYGAPWDRQGDI